MTECLITAELQPSLMQSRSRFYRLFVESGDGEKPLERLVPTPG